MKIRTHNAGLAFAVLLSSATSALAGEGGTSHVMPGAMATLADLPPTAPTSLFKVMYLDYDASAKAPLPTAAVWSLISM